MEQLVRLGKYALPQHISDIYFNDSFPLNNTIQKTRHKDKFVKIKTGDNEWNLRSPYSRDEDAALGAYLRQNEGDVASEIDGDPIALKMRNRSDYNKVVQLYLLSSLFMRFIR